MIEIQSFKNEKEAQGKIDLVEVDLKAGKFKEN